MSNSPLIAVLGASGGLGASTLALAVGRRLSATGPPALVIDLDTSGGGLDVTAGIEHLPGRRWPAFAEVRGRVDPDVLLGSLPEEEGCRLLSAGGPGCETVPARAVRDVLGSVLGAVRGPVVLDVPTRPPDTAPWLSHDPLLLVLSALHVYFRDMRFIVQAVLLVAIYLAPIIYPAHLLGRWAGWLDLNPTTGVVELVHAAVGASSVPGRSLVVSVVATVVLLVAGAEAHRRHDRLFVDQL